MRLVSRHRVIRREVDVVVDVSWGYIVPTEGTRRII